MVGWRRGVVDVVADKASDTAYISDDVRDKCKRGRRGDKLIEGEKEEKEHEIS